MDVIRITLHSDLCAGNGESRGNAVDTDIVLTAAGLPRIPARRLKGCLRAAAGELAALGDEAAAYTAELFGDKVGRQGCLWVGDAALPQEAAFTAWLKQNPAWADHSRVEQLYTDVRGQTRLKDGVADDGSLRFTRVLGQYDPLDKTKALVFEAPVRLENASPEAVRLLEHCCAATRHMGTHRNRGLGNVRLAYIPGADRPAAPQAPDLPAADTVTLTYHVRLKTPLTLPGCGEQLTAIPARSVIGCLAGAYLRQGTAADAAFRQLFLDGTARWSPLTPVISGEVSYPAPLALVYLKNDGVYANRCAETPTGKQKTLSGVYTARGKNGLLAASVPTITTYHHKHRDANSDATLYMQQAVQAGLVYGGTVTLPTALAGRAAALLSTAPLRFGRSKTAQYAVCELLGRITAAPVQEAQVTVRKGEPFFVLLETDLILDTDAPTPEAAAAALLGSLGVAAHRTGKDYLLYHTIGGYNAMWQMPKPRRIAVCGGSVYSFTADEDAALPAHFTPDTAEQVQEGFGCCRVLNQSEMAALTVERKAAVDTFDPTADGDCEPLRRALMLQQAKEVMQTTAWNLANGKTCRLDTGALGRLRLMLSEAENLQDLRNRVKSIKTKNKREGADTLLKSLYGTDTTPALPAMLAADPEFAGEMAQSFPQLQQSIADCWKLPLESTIHLLYYRREKEETENA